MRQKLLFLLSVEHIRIDSLEWKNIAAEKNVIITHTYMYTIIGTGNIISISNKRSQLPVSCK